MERISIPEPAKARDKLAISILTVVELPNVPAFIASFLALAEITDARIYFCAISSAEQYELDTADMLGEHPTADEGIKSEEILVEVNITESEFNEGVEILRRRMQVMRECREDRPR